MSKREFTPEEIAKSLRVCATVGNGCEACIYNLRPDTDRCYLDLRKIAADMIEAQAKRIGELEAELAKLREENRWIPVTERPPKLREPVLVSLRGCVQEGFLLSNGEWYCRHTVEGIEAVTHWKHMPKGAEAEHGRQ